MAGHLTPVRTVREQIAGQLRAEILAGDLPRGQRLREQRLAERFGVSRGPIRDVLVRLTQEGLLVSQPNCGVQVADAPGEWAQPLLVKVRREIEGFALRRSIAGLEERDIERLERIIDRLGEACRRGDLAVVAEQDIAFHQCLLEMAGEPDLVAIWLPIVTRMIMHYSRHVEMEQSYQEHVAILDAVRQRDLDRALEALEANIQ